MTPTPQPESAVSVSTGSRLHFGLTSVGRSPQDGQYSGVGVMIQSPRTELSVSPAARWNCRGSNRIRHFAQQWLDSLCTAGQQNTKFQIKLKAAPPGHCGLGSGTQLAMCVATGMNACLGIAAPRPQQVATVLGRGKRSMIGAYGFCEGGLIVCKYVAGHAENRDQLARRIRVPRDWRLLIINDRRMNSLSGDSESMAFRQLESCTEPFDHSRRSELNSLIESEIMASVERGQFDRFSQAIFEYGRLSGDYFRDIQGGAYNGRSITQTVQSLRSIGIKGVGQSSWGPTVFAWCESQDEAEAARRQMVSQLPQVADVWITGVCNRPADVTQAQNHHSMCSTSSSKT